MQFYMFVQSAFPFASMRNICFGHAWAHSYDPVPFVLIVIELLCSTCCHIGPLILLMRIIFTATVAKGNGPKKGCGKEE